MTDKPKRGRPPKTGAEATKTYGFRLTGEQYEQVKAYVRNLKAK